MQTKTLFGAPTQKVAAGAVAGALSALLVWVLNTFVLSPGHQMPAEAAQWFTILITFAVSYIVPPATRDQVVQSTNAV
jgi:hypothetical protein